MKIYDTLTKKKKVFTPRNKKEATMFVCGITPYDSPHIGNLRTFLNHDLIANYLRYKGYNLRYIQNITDIDDKIIKRAKEKNIGWKELGDIYFKELQNILKALDIKSVNKYAKATDYIKEIIKQVETLMKKGYAYEKNGTVFFDVLKFKEYGKLSGQNLKKLQRAERTEEDKDKKHPYDFALWKAAKPGEPAWDSPFGKGRPGWHIEDTAITEHFFGTQYDIHGGGMDLIFPHHECEIAQQEATSGKKPFVKYWMHSGFVNVDGEKMSKSFGNFVTAKELLAKAAPETIRFMMLSVHYRSPIDYSDKLKDQAKSSLKTLSDFTQRLKTLKPQKIKNDKNIASIIKEFFENMDDDFNTPKAIASIFKITNHINAKNEISADDKKAVIKLFKDFERIFKINVLNKKNEETPEEILNLAQKREELRKNKEWQKADETRAEMERLGYKVEDSKEGPKISKI
ncbi:cysteine--tRNA ligase [Candidatus Azambacteria bacterium]|nr:cysteine--tRNA ligase [Candidatus Azambacteria bacterium]